MFNAKQNIKKLNNNFAELLLMRSLVYMYWLLLWLYMPLVKYTSATQVVA